MLPNDIKMIDLILRHSQLSHRDFREVEMRGNDAFDYIRDLLSKTPGPRTVINGLKLLIGLAGQAAQNSAGPRLPEVFDVASTFTMHPELDVRTTAAHIMVFTLRILKGLGKGPDAVGGVARVLNEVRSALSAEPKAEQREMLEETRAELESQS